MQEVFVFCCVACPHFMLLWGCAILIAGWRHCMLTIASTDMLRTTKLSWNMPKITQIGSAVSNVLTIIQLWSGLVDSLFWATLYAWHSVVWFLSVKVARSWEACCSLGQVMDLVSAKRVLRRPVSIHWRPVGFHCDVISCKLAQPDVRQWRSQECELGGLPSLSSPSPLPSPLPFNWGPGYNPRNFFEIKGARRWVLEHFGPQN